MILGRDPASSVASIGPRVVAPGRPSRAVTLCETCGEEIKRLSTHFACSCGCGFASEWTRSLGGGLYVGRVIRPVTEEVSP